MYLCSCSCFLISTSHEHIVCECVRVCSANRLVQPYSFLSNALLFTEEEPGSTCLVSFLLWISTAEYSLVLSFKTWTNQTYLYQCRQLNSFIWKRMYSNFVVCSNARPSPSLWLKFPIPEHFLTSNYPPPGKGFRQTSRGCTGGCSSFKSIDT